MKSETELKNLINEGMSYYEKGDLPKAEYWFEKAAASGDVNAIHVLGLVKYKQDKLEEAEDLIHQAADHGDASAKHFLESQEYNQGKLESDHGNNNSLINGFMIAGEMQVNDDHAE